MTSYVLVPGACHGGWWYQPLVEALRDAGHSAHALTLGGLGPEGLAGAGPVTLDSHVEEVTAGVTTAGDASAQQVVLVGHSYGGSLITAAADRVPDRVRALVYLDAFVPEDGDSCWSMTNDEQRRWYIDGAGRTGLTVDPLPFFDERARPHPLATLVQRSRVTGAWEAVGSKTYVAATGWPDGLSASPFGPTARRLAAAPGWTYLEWPTRHNVLHDGPRRVLDLLLAT
jgi:pimeloyl-ACP methyl ester carboxylesterase